MTILAPLAGLIRRLRPSRIGSRLLAFNLLVVFLPIAGILYLDVYERELLNTQERGMIQEARALAASLDGSASIAAEASALLARLVPLGVSRIRIYDASGDLVADSARVVATAIVATGVPDTSSQDIAKGSRTQSLYRFGAWIAQLRHATFQWLRPGTVPRPSAEAGGLPHALPELRAALAGRYGSSTRPTPDQRSLTLSSAVPVRDGADVTGAVIVSQSTYRILQALYDVRLRIFQIVVLSVAMAVLLSAVMSATIVRPIVRLRRTAAALAERRSALPGRFLGADRHDEIGDLARALEELTRRLDAHLRLLEAFSADVAHEFKNPLAAIRSAAETIAAAEDPQDRQRFLAWLTRDVDRLERLVSGVRELAHIDAQMAHEPPSTTNLETLVAAVVDGVRLAGGGPLALRMPDGPPAATVRGSADRLAQVLESIIWNARSLAPPESQIEVQVEQDAAACRITISDRGPGIPAAHLERVFDRFFTYRPHEAPENREHAGLGLAIARTIVIGYGGLITAANRDGGGATFVVQLPRA